MPIKFSEGAMRALADGLADMLGESLAFTREGRVLVEFPRSEWIRRDLSIHMPGRFVAEGKPTHLRVRLGAGQVFDLDPIDAWIEFGLSLPSEVRQGVACDLTLETRAG